MKLLLCSSWNISRNIFFSLLFKNQ